MCARCRWFRCANPPFFQKSGGMQHRKRSLGHQRCSRSSCMKSRIVLIWCFLTLWKRGFCRSPFEARFVLQCSTFLEKSQNSATESHVNRQMGRITHGIARKLRCAHASRGQVRSARIDSRADASSDSPGRVPRNEMFACAYTERCKTRRRPGRRAERSSATIGGQNACSCWKIQNADR